MTAVSLVLATIGRRRAPPKSGMFDVSGDGDDSWPGIGMDDSTPGPAVDATSSSAYRATESVVAELAGGR